MPIREINSSECELAEPPLPTPLTRRECRRSCVEWRTSDWSEVKDHKLDYLASACASMIDSMCLIYFLGMLLCLVA